MQIKDIKIETTLDVERYQERLGKWIEISAYSSFLELGEHLLTLEGREYYKNGQTKYRLTSHSYITEKKEG